MPTALASALTATSRYGIRRDATTENTEKMQVAFFSDSDLTQRVAVSSNVSIRDTS